MKNHIHSPIFSTQAALWDGTTQISGSLEIWKEEVIFKLVDFKNSHLNLSIPLSIIDKVEEYLIFDLARNGLRIQNKNGKFDLFVIAEVDQFKRILLKELGSPGGI